MSDTMFAWLGSGRTRRLGVGLKGCLLDEAVRAHLPVPDGAVLLDAFYRLAVQEGLVAIENGRAAILDPATLAHLLYHRVRLPRLNGPLIIRPAFSPPAAGQRRVPIATIVAGGDDAGIARAIGRVWAAAPLDATSRHDTLLMKMVHADAELRGGTAVTGGDNQPDRVDEHTPAAAATTRQLPSLRPWQRPDSSLPPFARRLQQLLRGVRRTFGRTPHHVEWLDDGSVCWLLTIYPTEALCND